MGEKLPYYMAYPMPFLFDEEQIERKDYEYMKSLYPDAAKRILPYVEEECDRWTDPCSMIYDEYPDRLQLRLMCGRIYDRVREKERTLCGTGYEENSGQQTIQEQSFLGIEELHLLRKAGEHGKRSLKEKGDLPGREEKQKERQPKRSKQLYDLIEVMLYQELYRRRAEERRERRKFTPGYRVPPITPLTEKTE